MKLVITINDDIYEEYLKKGATLPKYGTAINSLYEALWNGTPLPEHHGRLISEEDMLSVILFSKLFDDAKVKEVKEALLNIPTIIEGSDGK